MIRNANDGREVASERRFVPVNGEAACEDAEERDGVAKRIGDDQRIWFVNVVGSEELGGGGKSGQRGIVAATIWCVSFWPVLTGVAA